MNVALSSWSTSDQLVVDGTTTQKFQEILWSYIIIAIVVILVGIILLLPNCTVNNILITVAWVVATLALMIASLYITTNTTGVWYYFAMIVTVLLVIFTVIWAGEYHNRGSHSHSSSYSSPAAATTENRLWDVGIAVLVVIGLMMLLGCALHSSNGKSYSIPAAAVATMVWLLIALLSCKH